MYNKNQISEKDFKDKTKILKDKKRVDINILLNRVRKDKKKNN